MQEAKAAVNHMLIHRQPIGMQGRKVSGSLSRPDSFSCCSASCLLVQTRQGVGCEGLET